MFISLKVPLKLRILCVIEKKSKDCGESTLLDEFVEACCKTRHNVVIDWIILPEVIRNVTILITILDFPRIADLARFYSIIECFHGTIIVARSPLQGVFALVRSWKLVCLLMCYAIGRVVDKVKYWCRVVVSYVYFIVRKTIQFLYTIGRLACLIILLVCLSMAWLVHHWYWQYLDYLVVTVRPLLEYHFQLWHY